MRDILSTDARANKKPSTPGNISHSSSISTLSSHAGCSTSLSDSRNDFSADNEFINDHKKVLQYLNKVDKNVAREFSELSDKIQHDVSNQKSFILIICIIDFFFFFSREIYSCQIEWHL